MNDPEEDTMKVAAAEGEGESQKQEVCPSMQEEIDGVDWEAAKGRSDLSEQAKSADNESCRIDQAVGAEGQDHRCC